MTFRDAISETLNDFSTHIGPANAVLAMPEMEAIRAWILDVGRDAVDEGWPIRKVLSGLPESVIDWVLGGDQ